MRRPASLRQAFLLLGTVLSFLVLLLVVAVGISVVWLVLLSTNLRGALDSDRAAMEIQFNLFRTARSREVFGETGERHWQQDAQESEARLVYWLDFARRLPKTPVEEESFSRLDSTVEGVRKNLMAVPPSEQAFRLSDYLAADTDATAFLEDVAARADLAIEHAERWSRIATLLAAVGGVIAAFSLASIGILARRMIYLPIVRLRDALEAHVVDTRVRVPEQGPVEFQTIGADVNAMMDRLAAEREKQLIFLAAIAHDLRNPMTALRTTAQLSERKAETEGQRQQNQRMLRQIDRMDRLVADLLDVGRIEAGRFELDLQRGDLREVVRDTCALYADVSEIHEVRCALPDEPVLASFDVTRISQVLGNLVGNAIKYSPDGGPVDVRLATRGDQAVIDVTDRGLGIPPEDQPTVFESFRRSARGTEGIPGVGLGLSVARRLVHAHHGTIDLESSPGEGTTFSVRLPR